MTGYDGVEYQTGDRVELHPHCEWWHNGARFGTVIGTSITLDDRVHVYLDTIPGRKFFGPENLFRKVK